MKIAIDGYEANVKERLGSSQWAYELINHLEKIDRKNEYVILLPSAPLDDLPRPRVNWTYKILKPKKFWTKIALPSELFLRQYKPDIFFSPTHYIPRFSPGKIKKIATIFDLSFLHFPEMFEKGDLWKLKNGTKFSAQNADYIITISNFSKQDIISQYNLNKKKITVVYPGYDDEKFKTQISNVKTSEIKRKYKIGDSYIIYIGTVQPRKNLVRLMEALAHVHLPGEVTDGTAITHLGGEQLQLVIVGKITGQDRGGWKFEEILATPKQLGIEDRVKFLGFVPTDELNDLLSGSLAFVLPSFWEGFGIPVVEAMATGVPVIVSNVSSLPEVVGNAGILVDPYSVDQIEQAIRVMVTDKKLRQKYIKLGLQQAQKFSWKKAANEVLKVMKFASGKDSPYN